MNNNNFLLLCVWLSDTGQVFRVAPHQNELLTPALESGSGSPRNPIRVSTESFKKMFLFMNEFALLPSCCVSLCSALCHNIPLRA